MDKKKADRLDYMNGAHRRINSYLNYLHWAIEQDRHELVLRGWLEKLESELSLLRVNLGLSGPYLAQQETDALLNKSASTSTQPTEQ